MKILVIEDEIKLANAIKRALETQKYIVDTSHDGQAGLDLAIGEKYDLLILDLMLPSLSGFEICQKVRSNHISTPILILTAKDQTVDIVAGLDTGADDYMVKPFSLEELFARIRSLVRRSTPYHQNILKLADLTLDPATFEVKRAKKLIKLSSKEFSLLEYLLRHQNTILTKNQIVQSVWPYDSNILPSTVEVHIKHLRDKLDTPFKTKLIHTVRGFGYQLKAEDV